MSAVTHKPNDRAAGELRAAAKLMLEVQDIIAQDKIIAQLDVAEMQKLQSLDFATQIIECVAAFITHSELEPGKIEHLDLRPDDVAARLAGTIP